MRGANEQPTQVGVAALGYAQLWIALAALIAPRTQAGVGAHIAHIFKTLWIFDLQNKIKRGERSYSRDLLQPKGLRIFCSGQNVDLTLEHGNARVLSSASACTLGAIICCNLSGNLSMATL